MHLGRFQVSGTSEPWYRIRIQEEIHAQSLEGAVVDVLGGNFIVTVEGSKKKIKRLYASLGEITPSGVKLSELELHKHKKESEKTGLDAESISSLISLLKSVSDKLDELNRRLDAVASRPSTQNRDLLSSEENNPLTSFFDNIP